MKATIDLWANFLANEKLTPQRVDPMVLLTLAEALSKKGGPKVRPHTAKLLCRELVCETAIELGIDLAGLKYHGKLTMARGLLDAWNKVYVAKFGSNFGTAGAKESKRRDVKTTVRQRVI